MNPRLIGWDGEKTLTFTLEDALLSPLSFSMLSGAGLIKGRKADISKSLDAQKIYTHATYDMVCEEVQYNGAPVKAVKLTDEDRNGATLVVSHEAPVYPMTLDSAGAQANFLSAVVQDQIKVMTPSDDGTSYDIEDIALDGYGAITNADTKTLLFILASESEITPPVGDSRQDDALRIGDTVRIDCYEVHEDGAYEMQIDADNFAGYYYIEASTLFRDEATGADLPAEFVIPRGKIQSNFTFTMSNSGDPSEQIMRLAA